MKAVTRYLLLAVFLVVVLGGGTLIGLFNLPDGWYAALRKPPFNPPNGVFGPVWSALYVLIAIAGWRTFLRRGDGTAKALWGVQMALNFLWSPAFFGLHRPELSLAVVVLLLIAICAFIGERWSKDAVAAWLFVPYLLWVAYATLLNGAIVILN
jgi:tryptophan-rich sensory protein